MTEKIKLTREQADDYDELEAERVAAEEEKQTEAAERLAERQHEYKRKRSHC